MKYAFHALALDERRYPYSPAVWERRQGCSTKLKQCWFPGAHSNVGGAYDDSGSANITLAWMMDQLSGNTMAQDPELEWKPREWIKFDDDYLTDWYDCELDWLEDHKTKPEYKGWGFGKLHDSLTPPQSWTGRKTRTPGRYHRTVYDTGKIDKDHPLQHTNEFVHSCVRARIDLGGREVEPDWSQLSPINLKPIFVWLWQKLLAYSLRTYKPHLPRSIFWGGPLQGWDLVDGHQSHAQPNYNIDMTPDGLDHIQWVYKGSETLESRYLPEDVMIKGGYESKLLSKDKKLAERLSFTNHGSHW